MVSQSKCQTEPDDDWPFDQAPDIAAISSKQVIESGYPICSSPIMRTIIHGPSCAAQPTIILRMAE